MPSAIQLKFRASGGAAGAPASLKSGEVAYNMADGKFYVGYGDNGSGVATSIKTFAQDNFTGAGTSYTAGTGLTLTGTVFTPDFAVVAALASPAFTGNPTAPTQTAGNNSTRLATTAYADAIAALKANLASPTFTGTPLAPTASPGANSTQIATTAYTDAAVSALSQGLNPKALVKAATTANLTRSGAQTVDGISLTAGMRILVKNQTAPAENGIYQVNAGAWTRVVDMDAWSEVPGAYVFVEQGSTQAEMAYVCTSDSGGTLDTTAITWVQFNGAGQVVAGTGITKAGNTIALDYTGAGLTLNSNSLSLTAPLLSLAGLTTAADKMIYATASNVYATTDLTSVARTLLAQTSQANMRATGLGLGTLSTQDASAVAITGGTMSGVTIDGGTF